jgi:hypothetical protein
MATLLKTTSINQNNSKKTWVPQDMKKSDIGKI